MPTYEYACVDCGTHVEVFQRFADESLTTCGLCGGRLRKVFHPAGILFKGSGFYRTDNRKGASDGASRDSKESAKTTAASSSSSSPSSSGSGSSSSTSSSSGSSGDSSKGKSA
jgi:putative FmdB family regulatory protein